MIEKLMTNSRVTEVDAVSIRMIGAYKNTGLSSDAHMVKIFSELKPKSELLTSASGVQFKIDNLFPFPS